MARIIALFSIFTGASLWHSGDSTLAWLAVLAGVLVFWSHYAMGRIAQATGNFAGEATSNLETLAIALNFVATVISLGFAVFAFFFK
ncbi:hypothetical protein ACD591_01150 [Rufibacter glacialis]|uniref:Uncharacterized protein n=1 Tax=Rufibacter glacialis TaxID=1259555 RepID=A0A5M8QL64_9BACT|nr:hypothetical protein [Rufibacter glacialis]KAA6435506.1 hypothetical protein FOE74_06050 [Rufibacter glacialis]GGK64101.1 hypothetical protein GCM10011405_10100 [Rufibacter glacialis]